MNSPSNPVRIARIRETLDRLENEGVEDVLVYVWSPDNVEFVSANDPSVYCVCYSKHIEELARKGA